MTMLEAYDADPDDGLKRTISWPRTHFSIAHVRIAIGLWLAFGGLAASLGFMAFAGAGRVPKAALTAAGIILGPTVGAISRGFQSCCLEYSISLLPYCSAALIGAVVIQVAVPPGLTWVQVVRLLAWAGGLIVWLGGGLISLAHALS